MFAQRIQLPSPETFIQSKPVTYPFKRFGTKPVMALSANLSYAHQTCFEQNREMLRNRRPAHCKVFGEGIDRFLSLREKIEQSPARRVGYGVEHIVRCVSRKHSLTLLCVSRCLPVKMSA